LCRWKAKATTGHVGRVRAREPPKLVESNPGSFPVGGRGIFQSMIDHVLVGE
jgi:hypothetical protein